MLNCWNQIGITGDRSCPELKTHIHCQNCPVYSWAGRSLLEREAPQEYIDEWTNLLSKEKSEKSLEVGHQIVSIKTITVGIFRLQQEWLALSAQLIKEVMPISTIHTLPHRSNNIFLGLVSLRGEVQICISLKEFLGIETADGDRQKISPVIYERMVVVEKFGNPWVFPVDEICGMHRIHPMELTNVPATLSKMPENYTQGLFNWKNQKVGYLDDELLFYALSKKVL
ncbi:chemotaxis protein CheW [Nostoc sp. CHAB 5784]|uniref:chemotaxis protein CheW n=1 Tax=Nostoc mirabile TaxID=2907820 RepID=UPI001E2B3868|nr:chemotaxis protein CheW [Nostoc mirabile]MCC5669299.1 chemotaxis protein CheW [Nostoc mirabile CHAB5784]